VIVRPLHTYDVSLGVKVAVALNVTVSVRSGGHSYVCASIKQDSLHFDMRRMDKVEMLPQKDPRVRYQYVYNL
jgi:FAD/FMN-containing dehydrogenase